MQCYGTTIGSFFNVNYVYVTEIAARETLEQVMADALSKCGSKRSSVRAVCLAVSGVNHPTDQQRILSWLRLLYITVSFFFFFFGYDKYILLLTNITLKICNILKL